MDDYKLLQELNSGQDSKVRQADSKTAAVAMVLGPIHILCTEKSDVCTPPLLHLLQFVESSAMRMYKFCFLPFTNFNSLKSSIRHLLYHRILFILGVNIIFAFCKLKLVRCNV